MITYAYICRSCGKRWENQHTVEERHKEKCSHCGKKANIDFSKSYVAISNWDHIYPLHITDLGPKPEDEHWVYSKHQHKELFKRYGMESPALI